MKHCENHACPHSPRSTELHVSHYRPILRLVAIAALAIATPVVAQMPGMMQGTQQQHMQQHMAQMQDLMRQMSDMGQRSEQMKQQMGQMQGGQMSAAHTAMPQMADHMSAMTTQMKGLMEQTQTMMKDQQMMNDRVMQHHIDDMQTHMAAMSKDMGKTLQTWSRCKSAWALPRRNPESRKPGDTDVERRVLCAPHYARGRGVGSRGRDGPRAVSPLCRRAAVQRRRDYGAYGRSRGKRGGLHE